MTKTTHNFQLLTGCYNLLAVKSMADLVVKNMREIGAPVYTEEEMNFAKEIQATIPKENILEALKRSKRPDWQSIRDVVVDRSIPEPWGKNDVMGGSTDVGDVSWKAPTMEFTTATWVLGIPGHSWQITAMGKSGIAQKSLIFAAKTMANCILDTLTDPILLQEIKNEWEAAKEGRKYVCPLPPDLKPPLDQFPSR